MGVAAACRALAHASRSGDGKLRWLLLWYGILLAPSASRGVAAAISEGGGLRWRVRRDVSLIGWRSARSDVPGQSPVVGEADRGGEVAGVGGRAGRGISQRSASKWVARFRSEGVAGLEDRSSVPRRMPRLSPADRVESIAALGRLRLTGAEISWILGMPLSTVPAKKTNAGHRAGPC